MSSDGQVMVRVRGLSKAYTISQAKSRPTTIAEAAMQRLRAPLRRNETETFWALRDVSFDIKQGDVVGIIGRNGAGKSTLLKILSRITEPTTGEIDLFGRVGSLLEVGTGFHPELTGRENVFLNGAILGMSKAEVRRQFDAIVDFAGIERFLDTPVKRYSSGMYVRLAFAVAAHLRSEILIVDEVLAVGDSEFQKKCLGKMGEVTRDGRVVVLVSHDLSAIAAICHKAILMRNGSVLLTGAIEPVLELYTRQQESEGALGSYRRYPNLRQRDDAADSPTIESAVLTSEGRHLAAGYPTGAPLEFEVTCCAPYAIESPALGIGISDLHGNRLTTLHSRLAVGGSQEPVGLGTFKFRCATKDLALAPGIYTVKLALDGSNCRPAAIDSAFSFIVTENPVFMPGGRRYAGMVLCRQHWTLNS